MEQFHSKPLSEICGEFKSTPDGLSSAEATNRLLTFGHNRLEAQKRISPWMLLFEQFKNVLIITLLIATGISAFLGHGIEAIAIAVIVLFAVFLGFIQEYRAEKAIDALKSMAAPTAKVLRDGKEQVIAASEIVPGDVFFFAAGDRIPADARLIQAINLRVEEASLTGESLPSEKKHDLTLNDLAPLGDRKNMVFAGTSVSYGRGRAIAVSTGMKTEFGKIAKMLQQIETEKTPLQKNLDNVGTMLARIAIVIVLIIVALGLFRGQPFIEMLIFGIALAVAVVPEALPAVVTISLALGVQRMVKRHALMRRLPAVETLGSTTVICSDKTGTLTRDEMTVTSVFVADTMLNVSGAGYIPAGAITPVDAGGLWSTLVNISLFQWARTSGRSITEAMTMTFVSLVLIQFFKAYNFRSERDPVFKNPFANKWLNLAIVWELVMLAVVIYFPVLQKPFGTFCLTWQDWTIVTIAALTVVPVIETTKWIIRRGWFGLAVA